MNAVLDQNLLVMAQSALDGRPPEERTISHIKETVSLCAQIRKVDETGQALVIKELVSRFSFTQSSDSVLVNSADHEEWLADATDVSWYYWERYRTTLLSKLAPSIVSALDDSTNQTLSLLENPQRPGRWDRRGLVVGHVQSGKTSHYSGLICKAADAGYKFIIVLAGLHNNLRAQTQIRLEEAFLGYNTVALDGTSNVIGVGTIHNDPERRPNSVTTRAEDGDFRTRVRTQLGVSPERRPWLFVIKKNVSVLKQLRLWLKTNVASRGTIDNLPLLLIDDESDHGSIDTNEQYWDESDGTPDMAHDPTATNREIRGILNIFSRKAYVAYTATPFANIFIHDEALTDDEGDDLFPRSFIVNLSAASNYIGPQSIFGVLEDGSRSPGAALIRSVEDTGHEHESTGWMPTRHRSTHRPVFDGESRIPPSLVDAIDAFLLSSAIRSFRGQGREHASMLVHVTRYIAVQQSVATQITEHLHDMKGRLRYKHDDAEILERLRARFNSDFTPTHATMKSAMTLASDLYTWPSWEELVPHLYEILQEIRVRTINGSASDILDYETNRHSGLKVIAVGGDKLARGLTLEGLSVSYFLRAAGTYDTLMQMGRWFGYRDGYVDICRLYTSNNLVDWFEHITAAAAELREEFDRMAASNGTPKDYGLKVQAHPTLMVTARNKMRNTRRVLMDCGGHSFETTVLPNDAYTLRRNVNATRNLIRRLGAPIEGFVPPWRKDQASRLKPYNGDVWTGVPSHQVLQFLDEYVTHAAAPRTHAGVLRTYIDRMNKVGEITQWTVAIAGGNAPPLAGDLETDLPLRRIERKISRLFPTSFSVKRVGSPRDEALDLCPEGYDAALRMTIAQRKRMLPEFEASSVHAPSGPFVRDVRGFGASPNVPATPDRALLMLYAVVPVGDLSAELALDEETPPVGFLISFPATKNAVGVEYAVNNVLWSSEVNGYE